MEEAEEAPSSRTTVAALAVTETVSWGVLYYAFAVVVTPMQADLRWSMAVLSGGFSLGLLVSGLLAPAVGAWVDRYGPRAVMTPGSVLATGAVVAWAGVRTPVGFYAAWTLLGAAMAATLYEPAVATVAAYGRNERLKALLAVTTAAGLASTIFSPTTEFLGARLGWRGALLALAGALALLTIPLHALALPGRRRGEVARAGPLAADPSARPRTDLRRVTLVFSVTKAVSVGVTAHLVAFLILAGHTAAAAAALAAVVGAGKVGGRVLVAFALRRADARQVSTLAISLQGLVLVLPMLWRSPAVAAVLLALFGASAGAVTILRPVVMGEGFGPEGYGWRNGRVALAEKLAGAIAPLLVGVGVTVTSGYGGSWVTMAALCLAAGAGLRPRLRRPLPG